MIDICEETESYVASVVELGGLLLEAETLAATLERVVALACRAIGECEYASVASMDGREPSTLASTDPIAAELDQTQYKAGCGPCLDALRDGHLVSVPSVDKSEGWEPFRSKALALGVHSSLSVPMVAGGAAVGSLNVYGQEIDSFSDVAHDSALLLAAQAAVAVANARTYHHTRELVANLESALLTRDLIGQAKGIIMVNDKVTSVEAFEILRRASQLHNVKLRDIAAEVADTGLTPRVTA